MLLSFILTIFQRLWMKSEKKIVVFRIIGRTRKEKMLLIFPDLYLILKKSCNISFLSLRAWDESNQVILSITKVDEVLVLFAYAGDPRHNEMMFCSGEEFCIFTRNFLTLFLLVFGLAPLIENRISLD